MWAAGLRLGWQAVRAGELRIGDDAMLVDIQAEHLRLFGNTQTRVARIIPKVIAPETTTKAKTASAPNA
jgi:hypothetical protein